MIFVIGAIALFFLLKGNSQAQIMAAASNSPINQATGNSLSATLGNKAASPDTYQTGNPGYTAPARPSTQTVAGTSVARQAAPVRSGVGSVVGPTKTPTTTVPGGAGRATSTIIRAPRPISPTQKPIVTTKASPEVASAFWTKLTPQAKSRLLIRTVGQK